MKIRSFTNLDWYDAFIDFLFKFAAKTSEPLLAAGLVVSAADFLSDGSVMSNNPLLAIVWAWTQAFAIETSAGVTLVYAFQSRNAGDRVKSWLYSFLAALLSLVGATMLFLQLVAHAWGVPETQITAQFIWLAPLMAALRSLVAIGYIVMCRAKPMRFSGQQSSTTIPPERLDLAVTAAVETAVNAAVAKMQERISTTLASQSTLPGADGSAAQHKNTGWLSLNDQSGRDPETPTSPIPAISAAKAQSSLLDRQASLPAQQGREQTGHVNGTPVASNGNTRSLRPALDLPGSQRSTSGTSSTQRLASGTASAHLDRASRSNQDEHLERGDTMTRLEAVWARLSEQERQSITGNALYEMAGRGMRKQRVYQFLQEKFPRARL